MVGMVIFGLVLSGFVERSATVALLALSDPLSSADFAEYVANTSYVTRYCAMLNDTDELNLIEDDEDVGPDEDVSDSSEEDDGFIGNETTHVAHGRHIVAEPHLKVMSSFNMFYKR